MRKLICQLAKSVGQYVASLPIKELVSDIPLFLINAALFFQATADDSADKSFTLTVDKADRCLISGMGLQLFFRVSFIIFECICEAKKPDLEDLEAPSDQKGIALLREHNEQKSNQSVVHTTVEIVFNITQMGITLSFPWMLDNFPHISPNKALVCFLTIPLIEILTHINRTLRKNQLESKTIDAYSIIRPIILIGSVGSLASAIKKNTLDNSSNLYNPLLANTIFNGALWALDLCPSPTHALNYR